MKIQKHAALITAYKNFSYLEALVKKLSPHFSVYIHIDKSSTEIDAQKMTYLEETYGCRCFAKYVCCWAGFNNLLAYVELLRIAHANHHEYYHILSGEDLPVRTYAEIEQFFQGNDKIYISFHQAKDALWEERYYIFVNKDPHKRLYATLNKLSIGVQKLIGIRRTRIGSETQMYKGYIFGSLPHDAVAYVVQYVDANPAFMKDLATTFISEEFFLQTILGNSPYKDRIAHNCLRYSVGQETGEGGSKCASSEESAESSWAEPDLIRPASRSLEPIPISPHPSAFFIRNVWKSEMTPISCRAPDWIAGRVMKV